MRFARVGGASAVVKSMALPRAWKAGRAHSTHAKEVKRKGGAVGLYGYPILSSPKGFQAFAEAAIEKSEALVAHIKDMPPSLQTIRTFDDLSDTICSVVDSAELCRNTHPDMEFVTEASQASMKVYEYLHQLNANPALYNAIIKVEQAGVLVTEESRRAAETLRMDFERGGIDLPPEKLQRVHELNLQITRLGREFVDNILLDPGQVDIFPASKLPKCIRNLVQPIFRSKDGTVFMTSKPLSAVRSFYSGVRVTTDAANLSSLLHWAVDSEVRKQAFFQGYSAAKGNHHVLDQIIGSRHELAQLLGYKSFAEFIMAPTMAASPDVVKDFLVEMSKGIRSKADQERKMKEQFRKKVENGIDTIHEWDEAYYSSLLKTHLFDINSTVLAGYFSLERCVEGLKIIVENLFGATFKQSALDSGEIWHPDVQKLTLHSLTEGDIGHMYLDLYAREGKFPGSAHFAIRGGRRVSETEYQLPIVAVVCNFSSVRRSCPLLSHMEVETLFHEFGHALHSMLSRTEYQHFSGTRTVIDFAEIPSNLFEYYAWDFRFLSQFAKHYATGEVIPKAIVEALNKSKRLFAATELQSQIIYALTDQVLFGEKPLPANDVTSVIADLKEQYTGCKHVDGTHWHTRFNHFVTYGGAYYSYLYARCFAASLWQKICVKDPLSLETGEILRKRFLQHGGAKDPVNILRDSLGEKTVQRLSCGIRPAVSDLLVELEI